MKLYDGIVRIGGLTTNEVFKPGMTAAEVMVLRALHGADAVVSVNENGKVKRTSAEERGRLKSIYADPSSLTGVDALKKQALFTNLFGHDQLPLPDDLAEPVEAEAEDFAA